MKTKQTRRQFLKGIGLVAATGLAGAPHIAFAGTKKVVIVGGGTSGATAARYLKLADSSIQITLIEVNKTYYTCYSSNEVLGGNRDIKNIQYGYDGLIKMGIKVVIDRVTTINPENRRVTVSNGDTFDYDRCIVAPGISFKYDKIEGYDEKVAEDIPHAWKAGPQTITLRKQLVAMKDGGTVVIAAPPNPYRCPPAPYERASQIANYLTREKPKSKIIISDAKPLFSAQAHFFRGWKKLYGYDTDNSMIEWRGEAGVISVDAAERSMEDDFGDVLKPDVLNIIPAQQAGKIAFDVGLTNADGWCPVKLDTFESTLHENIHVIGDASLATGLSKSGYAASTEAKVCAAAIAALLNDKEPGSPSFVNTCFSIIGTDYGVSIAAVYRLAKDKSRIVKVAGGLTPLDATDEQHRREVAYAHSWLNNITADAFGL